MERQGGFTEKAALQSEKYLSEYEEFVPPLFTPKLLRLAEGDSHPPFAFQISGLHSLMGALRALYLIHLHAPPESFQARSREVLDPFGEMVDIMKYKWRYREPPRSTRYRTQLIKFESKWKEEPR